MLLSLNIVKKLDIVRPCLVIVLKKPAHNSGQKLVAIRRLGVRNVSFCNPESICKDI
jgi:hypothetical protein